MQLTEEVQKLSLPQKAELYYLLRNDSELNDYINIDSVSSQILFEEINRRDKAYDQGEMKLTTRAELTTRLKARRNAL